MQYSFISAAFLALASSVVAQTAGFDVITSPVKDQKVAAGSPFEIVWQPGKYTEDKDTATISLLQGATPETLQPGQVVVASVKNSLGKYTWNVPSDIPAFDTYGFQITLDSDKAIFQYSFPFHITGTFGIKGISASESGTTTIHLGTGTAYTPKPTANSTTIVPTTSKNATSVKPTPKPSSNYTLTTGITTVKSTPSTPTSAPSSTSSVPAQQTTNAAMANAVSGSLALIGGVVLAFAL